MINKSSMKCNRPQRTPDGPKKFVVKACSGGREKIVRYGDPEMKIKKHIAARRLSFRARHNCAEKKDPMTAGYWACKAW